MSDVVCFKENIFKYLVQTGVFAAICCYNQAVRTAASEVGEWSGLQEGFASNGADILKPEGVCDLESQLWNRRASKHNDTV